MNRQMPQMTRMADWMRKTTIKFFERNPDAIAAPGFVAIGNKMVADVMRNGFEVLSRDSFFITCRARQILLANVKGDVIHETDIFQAESSLNALFVRVHDYFDARIRQGEQKLESAGFGANEIVRHTINYETRSVTNAVTQYLDILAKADLYLAILHYLWLTGELADNPEDSMRYKLTAERDARQQLYGITRISNSHYNNIRKIVNGVLEIRRAERTAQAARDRALATKSRKRRSEKSRDLVDVQEEMDALASV